MKITLILCSVAVMLVLAGCQAPKEHTSQTAVGGVSMSSTGGQLAGHGESGIQDYREVLASPGPFD